MARDPSREVTEDWPLAPVDKTPIIVTNPQGSSPFLLIGDHAGNSIPSKLCLGVGAADSMRHIAWDIGVATLGAALAARLDAVFVHQRYSRLVIDCNRDPALPEAIPEASDGTPIPGNARLTPADRAARIAAIHEPYHQAIAAEIARRATPPVLVSLHSFTPEMAGVARPWAIGVLHDGGADGFARTLLSRLYERSGLVVGDNQPYRMDATDHTVPRHAFARGLSYVELEVRQDLLAADPEGWATLLANELPAAVSPPAPTSLGRRP
jgi:predicted N-formylglutamate amidohydrolase